MKNPTVELDGISYVLVNGRWYTADMMRYKEDRKDPVTGEIRQVTVIDRTRVVHPHVQKRLRRKLVQKYRERLKAQQEAAKKNGAGKTAAAAPVPTPKKESTRKGLLTNLRDRVAFWRARRSS